MHHLMLGAGLRPAVTSLGLTTRCYLLLSIIGPSALGGQGPSYRRVNLYLNHVDNLYV